jgi:hypothetical protein
VGEGKTENSISVLDNIVARANETHQAVFARAHQPSTAPCDAVFYVVVFLLDVRHLAHIMLVHIGSSLRRCSLSNNCCLEAAAGNVPADGIAESVAD